jgi:FAD/FMN-containing dehydrogenase
VSDAVTCAAAAGLKVQAKSGGHSYASFSTGGKDGSLIVNLQNFNSISVDASMSP